MNKYINSSFLENNIVNLIGTLVTKFSFDHELYGEKFYRGKIATLRNSGVNDIIPIIVSERLLNSGDYDINTLISIEGKFKKL